MQFITSLFFAFFAVCTVSAQFYPWSMQFMPVDHLEPSLFPGPPQAPADPGLFNFIPNLNPVHTINRPPTPLGWGRK